MQNNTSFNQAIKARKETYQAISDLRHFIEDYVQSRLRDDFYEVLLDKVDNLETLLVDHDWSEAV